MKLGGIKKSSIGKYAFMVGFFGAIVLALLMKYTSLIADPVWYYTILIIAGVIIGLLNITPAESNTIMLTALAIGIGTATLGSMPFVGGIIDALLTAIAYVMLPTGVVVAIASFMQRAKN